MRARRASVGDEAIVRTLRLEALSDAPDAFDSHAGPGARLDDIGLAEMTFAGCDVRP